MWLTNARCCYVLLWQICLLMCSSNLYIWCYCLILEKIYFLKHLTCPWPYASRKSWIIVFSFKKSFLFFTVYFFIYFKIIQLSFCLRIIILHNYNIFFQMSCSRVDLFAFKYRTRLHGSVCCRAFIICGRELLAFRVIFI